MAVHAAATLALLGSSTGCLAFGDAGALPPCASFTSCSAAVGGSATWTVRNEVTAILGNFIMPSDLAPGVTVYQGSASVATTAPLSSGNGCTVLPCATGEFYRGASAGSQSDFAVNRVQTNMSHGVAGTLTRGNGSASVSLRTFAEATSAWRDVFSFSGSGSLSAVVAIDGSSGLGPVGVFGPSFDFHPTSTYADWIYDLRVWDVTNLSVSDDFELGGPTPVGRARLNGYNEQRGSFTDTVPLSFDFVSGVSYVLTAELRAISTDGREIDLYNTARLQDMVLTGGAQLTALSGHDYLAAVPEPAPAALLWLGLAAVGWWSRGRLQRPRG
jgi:hypothetical protein